MSDIATETPPVAPPAGTGDRARDYGVMQRTGFDRVASSEGEDFPAPFPGSPLPEESLSDFIENLNRRIAGDMLASKVLIMQPPEIDATGRKEKAVEKIRAAAEKRLRKQGVTVEQASSATDTLAKNTTALLNAVGGGFASFGLYSSNADGTPSTGNFSDPAFVCAAVPLPEQSDVSKIFQGFLLGKDNLGPAIGKDFQGSFLGVLANKHVITHELGHCIDGARQEEGESRLMARRRWESTADIFSLLYLAQTGEPGLKKFSDDLATFRSANIAGTAEAILYDTAQPVRYAMGDLPRLQADPDFKHKSFGELHQMASRYAREGLRRDYPHAYGGEAVDNAELRQKSKAIDNKLGGIARYAQDQWRGQGDTIDHLLDVQEAALLVRISDAANKVTGNRNNPLAREVDRLREQQPGVFGDAYQALGITPPALQAPEHQPPPQQQKTGTGKSSTKSAGLAAPGMGFEPASPFG